MSVVWIYAAGVCLTATPAGIALLCALSGKSQDSSRAERSRNCDSSAFGSGFGIALHAGILARRFAGGFIRSRIGALGVGDGAIVISERQASVVEGYRCGVVRVDML